MAALNINCNVMMSYIPVIGRIIFGLYFFQASINHFRNANGMAGYAASKGVPMPKLAILGTGALLLLGSLGVIFNMYVQIAALLLVIFLVPVTFTMHAYWNDTDPHVRMGNRINFYKNLALLGAVLMFF